MGLFIPGLSGLDHASRGSEPRDGSSTGPRSAPEAERLPVGVGVHTGTAFVGAVGHAAKVEDFTALGDAVNTTARLASVAASGEALISVEAAAAANLATEGLERRHLEVKGRTQPVDVLVVRA